MIKWGEINNLWLRGEAEVISVFSFVISSNLSWFFFWVACGWVCCDYEGSEAIRGCCAPVLSLRAWRSNLGLLAVIASLAKQSGLLFVFGVLQQR